MSKPLAEQVALDRCADWKTGDCRIDLSYRNQCVAAAAAHKGGGTPSAASLDGAKAQAMKICDAVSGGECRIMVAERSEPVFRKY